MREIENESISMRGSAISLWSVLMECKLQGYVGETEV